MGDRQYSRLLADVLSFGWVLPASIAAGAGLGWVLDRFLGIFPVLTAVLGVLGFAGGILQLWREMNVLTSRSGGEDGPDRDGPASP
jgi:F0F1-type ATP synthase assembly protein I